MPDSAIANVDEAAAAIDRLADRLGELAAPEIDAMLSAIRAEVDAAQSFDDLAERLLRLSARGVDGFAALIEQGSTIAALKGHDSASEEAK